jgi:flagellar hook-length control protein FliK
MTMTTTTTMLAACVTPAASPAPSAKAVAGAEPAGGADFAGCMDQALEAAAASPVVDDGAETTAATADAQAEPGADEASKAGEMAAAVAVDLSALLPGWTPPPPVAGDAGTRTVPDAQADSDVAVAAVGTSTKLPAALTNSDAQPALPAASLTRSSLRDAALSAGPAAAPRGGDEAAVPMPHADAAAAPHADAAAAPRAMREKQTVAEASAEASPIASLAPASARAAVAAPQPAAAAPTSAALPAPVHSPAFAPALATQVRWWAGEGVQQAQLTLNPPEMGPVAVRIVVAADAREARIDFSADVAATRGAIEAALPVLAAALDESGLKLAGGGVHDGTAQRQAAWDQAQQQQRHAAARSSGSVTQRTDDRGLAVPGTGTAPHGAARGLVDLIA